jgi:hypothetical protein
LYTYRSATRSSNSEKQRSLSQQQTYQQGKNIKYVAVFLSIKIEQGNIMPCDSCPVLPLILPVALPLVLHLFLPVALPPVLSLILPVALPLVLHLTLPLTLLRFLSCHRSAPSST